MEICSLSIENNELNLNRIKDIRKINLFQDEIKEEEKFAKHQQGKETISEDTAPEETITRKRIEITGIRDLPRANWYLCNNSFLVHGFFNYHYLLLKTVETGDKKRLFLGVPGIYEQPERMMALIFGFSEFEPEQSEDPGCKTSSSGDRTGTFGYWMCELLP